MKRSEMVSKLEVHLGHILAPDEADYQSRLILTILESAGMLPPILEKVWMGVVIDELNEWEPEE